MVTNLGGRNEGNMPAQANNTEEPTRPMDKRIVLWPVSYLILLVLLAIVYGALGTHLPSYIRNPLQGMPLSVVWFGALGGVMVSLHGIFLHNREWKDSYTTWHAFSGIVGAVYGAFGYLALMLIINSTTSSTTIVKSSATFDLAAFVLGYSQHEFQALLRKVTNLLFGPGRQQGQGPDKQNL